MAIKDIQKQLATVTATAKTLYSEMETDAAKQTDDNREKFDKLLVEAKDLREKLHKERELEELDKFVNDPASKHLEIPEPAGGDDGRPAKVRKSWGDQFTDSPEFKAGEKLGFTNPNISGVEVKAIYEATAATGGAAVFSERRTEMTDQVPVLAPNILDLINISPTNSSSIDFVTVTGYTNAAAEVLEFTAGNFGAKPESNLTFALNNSPVQTIAHWVQASRNILADVPRLQNMINTKLIQGLRRRLGTQAILGNGTAPNLRGFQATSGIQTRSGAVGSGSARFVSGDTMLDTLRRSITDVALAGGTANGIVLNPADAEKAELQKDDAKNYQNIYDPVAQRLWRVRVVEDTGMQSNRGLVGDFMSGAALYLREDAVIRVFDQHSDLAIRNALVILAELRAALAVFDPELFVDVNTLS